MCRAGCKGTNAERFYVHVSFSVSHKGDNAQMLANTLSALVLLQLVLRMGSQPAQPGIMFKIRSLLMRDRPTENSQDGLELCLAKQRLCKILKATWVIACSNCNNHVIWYAIQRQPGFLILKQQRTLK